MFQTNLSKLWNGFTVSSNKMALDCDSNNMIEIRDGFKRYSTNNVVFQGLNMTVKKGTIYGLLGPSGCGKTTLLNCITGISTLDAGTIFVRSQNRRQIGYMPQEIALMEQFKIVELLHYFGKIYGMDHDTVVKRAKELLSLVNLPPEQFYHLHISSLSGGQQRRVSLLVALIHDPDLLILDEPTVGLDSVTRFSLWEFFLKETEQRQKTILITTHYTEEARESHMVGMMRCGVLLAEDRPAKLFNDYKCTSLEEVFSLLSQSRAKSPETKPFPRSKLPPPAPFSSKKSYCNLNRLFAQLQRHFCWIRQNIWMMVLILVVPGLILFLFCTLRANDLGGIQVAIVSEEFCSNKTISSEPRCDKDLKISCLYFQRLENMGYIVSEYPDLPSGMNALSKGHATGLLHFGHDYTPALLNFFSSSTAHPPENETLTNCQLQVTLDKTEKLKAYQLIGSIKQTFYSIQKDLLRGCGQVPLTSNVFVDPVQVYGLNSIELTQNDLPGFIIPFVFYLAASYTSTAASSEKSSGLFRRSLVSGLTKLEMNLAHAGIQVLVSLVQNCMIVAIMYATFNSWAGGSVLTASVFIVLTEIQGMLYGIFIASIIKNEGNIAHTVTATTISFFLTTGVLWPIEGMISCLKCVLVHSPLIQAAEAYRSITIRGWGLDNPKIMSAVWNNMATIAILLVANILSAKSNRTC